MSGLRAPVVSGVAGGVGTTTLATALHADDATGRPGIIGDVVVCRATGDSLRRAAALAEHLGPGPRPVLAVNAEDGTGRPLQARLRMIEPHYTAVVLLPRVGRWATLADPLAEAAGMLAVPARDLPRAVRPYAAALQALARAVALSGRLYRPLPGLPVVPAPPRPRYEEPVTAPQPAVDAVPLRPAVAPRRSVRILAPEFRIAPAHRNGALG